MRDIRRVLWALIFVALAAYPLAVTRADSGESTRVTGEKQHVRTWGGGYPYRERSEYVLKELDLKPGDVVVDIEHYQKLAVGGARDHAWSPGLLTQQADEADWILLRSELITGTHHFIAILAQKELFPAKHTEKKSKGPGAEKTPAAEGAAAEEG